MCTRPDPGPEEFRFVDVENHHSAFPSQKQYDNGKYEGGKLCLISQWPIHNVSLPKRSAFPIHSIDSTFSVSGHPAPWSELPTVLLQAELARRQDGDSKPECGSGGTRGSYNTPLHVAALIIILVLSTAGWCFSQEETPNGH